MSGPAHLIFFLSYAITAAAQAPEVEYRVVGHDLLLRDVEANLVVDLIPNAIP